MEKKQLIIDVTRLDVTISDGVTHITLTGVFPFGWDGFYDFLEVMGGKRVIITPIEED